MFVSPLFVTNHSLCRTLRSPGAAETVTLKLQRVKRLAKKAAWSPHLWFSVEWRLLHERRSLLGANRRRPRERLGGNYILVFLCYGASLIQYSQTHRGGRRAISKPGHFLALLPQTPRLRRVFQKFWQRLTSKSIYSIWEEEATLSFMFVFLDEMCLWGSFEMRFFSFVVCSLAG